MKAQKIPIPITAPTERKETPPTSRAPEHITSRSMDQFFTYVRTFAEREYDIDHRLFEIRSGEIAYDGKTVTNDRITYLTYRGEILAGVLETRTEFNHIQSTFFCTTTNLEKVAKQK